MVAFTVVDGHATGNPNSDDPYILLLDGEAHSELPQIDTARFHYLNFDLYLERAGTKPDAVARVLWYTHPSADNTSGDLVNWFNYPQHYNLDLSTLELAHSSGGWNGMQSTLRLDPTEQTDTGAVPPLFRLGPVTLTADPTVQQGDSTTISWQLLRGGGTVDLYYDQVKNFSGTLIAANIAATDATYQWHVSSTVTPGRYWVRAVVNDGVNTRQFYGDAPLVVTAPGSGGGVQIAAPNGGANAIGEGDDFFTQQLGNPIDFRDDADVSFGQGWADTTMADGTWTGTSAAGVSDAHFFLLYPGYDGRPGSGRGYDTQIDPLRYSHLVFQYTVSSPTAATVYWMSPGDPYAHTWGNSDIYQMEPGTHILDMDLNKRDGAGSRALWTAEHWGGLRLGPASGTPNLKVTLNWVRLVPAPDEPPTRPLSWTCDSCRVAAFDVYADLDNNPDNGGLLKLASAVPSGSGTYNVPVGKLAAGNYYLAAFSSGETPAYSPGTFSVVAAGGYIDVPSSNPFYDYITRLTNIGVVQGYDNNAFRNVFRWEQNASRANLARWVVKAQPWALVNPATPTFVDVPPDDPDYRYIETAKAHGVISGYDPVNCPGGVGPCFKPENMVTRGQMSKMIVNAMGWAISAGAGHFSDVLPANPFYGQVETLYAHGAVSGYADGTFRWQAPFTRGQLSKVLYKSLNP